MQGSVRKKGNKWTYRIDVGSANRRKQIERGGFKTKKEALAALNDAIYYYNNTGDYIENKKITFDEIFNEFITKEAPATRAYATIKRYKSLHKNHFKDYFGSYYMYRISAIRIEDFIRIKTPIYSEEYVKGLFKFLKVLFGYAYKRKYIKKNVFEEVTPPPDPRHIGEIYTYTTKEIRAMAKRLKSTNLLVAYYIALNTGLRESECFALRWEDVDFKNRKIKITKQLLFQDKKWCFCPLKTLNAYRSVNITNEFAEYLLGVKNKQEQERILYGDGWKRNYVTDRLTRNKEKLLKIDDFINIKQNGEMLTGNSVKFMSRIIKEDLGIHFKFHNLRHTFASLLAENGVSPKYVQHTLGHAKFEFTLKYYTHITEKMSKQAVRAVNSALAVTYNT